MQCGWHFSFLLFVLQTNIRLRSKFAVSEYACSYVHHRSPTPNGKSSTKAFWNEATKLNLLLYAIFATIETIFSLTGILITRAGISNKIPTGTEILEKVGNGIETPLPSRLLRKSKCTHCLFFNPNLFYSV